MTDDVVKDAKAASNKKLKKYLLLGNLFFDIFIIIPIILYFVIVPRNEIERLSNEYVKSEYKSEKVKYTIVKKKPAAWVRLKDINYTAAHAIVVSEDWFFYNHNGYDLSQIRDAFTDKITKGKRIRGASTISQQVVKNLFLTNERSLWRKVKELAFAIVLERNVNKEKILEIYLNIIEYGKGIYGIKNASRHYFKKSPKSLTAREGAFLAMLLPSPVRYSQSFKEGKVTEYASKTINSILNKMVKAKYLKEEQLAGALNQKFRWEARKSGKSRKRKAVRKNKNNDDGKSWEARYKNDNDLAVDDNPTFDEDALIEDASGLSEEFNVD